MKGAAYLLRMFTVKDLLQGTQGKLLKEVAKEFPSISTDTRTLNPGEIFIPLDGENFKGHNFISKALEKKTGAILISQDIPAANVTTIRVNDTLTALQNLGHYWRKKNKSKIVAITGSNGKTTTKFFLKNILENKFDILASEKSFNNHIGVPLTLLNIRPETEICLVEMGTNHPGEIATLVKIAEPDIAVVTVVGEAHIGLFGSKDLIANEKREIYRHPEHNPLRVYNLDNEWTKKMYLDCKNPTQAISFSLNNKADVLLHVTSETLDSMVVEGMIKDAAGKATVSFVGHHNVYNLMAAAGCALWCGMTPQEIWEQIPKCKTTWGRNQVIPLQSKAKMIFDAYNANPDSMKALIETGSTLKTEGKKILILGDMQQLGEFAVIRHEELGRIAGKANFELIWFMGENFENFERGVRAAGFSKKLILSNSYEDSLASSVGSMLQPNDIVFIKGSRAAKLERVIPHLNPVDWTEK